MEYSIHTIGNLNILAICGSLDRNTVGPIRAWIEKQMDCKPACAIINLKEVSYMDSSGLAALVAGLNQARKHNGDVWLCSMPNQIRILFELTRLDQVFEIYPTEAAAVQMFTSQQQDNLEAKH
jgi:anti-sigma B factor antagonist